MPGQVTLLGPGLLGQRPVGAGGGLAELLGGGLGVAGAQGGVAQFQRPALVGGRSGGRLGQQTQHQQTGGGHGVDSSDVWRGDVWRGKEGVEGRPERQ